MANHYLKATGNWSAAATWSDTDGGAAGAAAPVAGDAVFFTANGNGLTCTIDGASACDSILASGGCTATLAGTQTITVGGNVTLLASMTVPNTITWVITGTGNFAGATLTTLGTINLNGTAHTVSGAFTCVTLRRTGTATKTDSVTFTSGTTVTCTNFAMIGNSATNRLLAQSSTLGSAATITATNQAFENVDFMDITLTMAYDHTANLLTNSGFETGDPPTGWTVNGAGATWSRSTDQVYAETYSGKLIRGGAEAYCTNPTILNGFVYNGISLTATARVYAMVASRAYIGIYSPSGSNIQSSAHSGGSAWELLTISGVSTVVSGQAINGVVKVNTGDTTAYFDSFTLTITGTIGDCGGNTGITFTPAVAQTWDGTTANWSPAARWTSRVPLPQDDVSAGGAGNTITVDMPRIGKSITFTGTPTVSLSVAPENYGSFTMASGMTYTVNALGNFFRGRGSYTLTTAGKTLHRVTWYAVAGTYTLQDALTITEGVNHYNGSFIDGGNSLSGKVYWSDNSNTRGITKSGTWTLHDIVTGSKWYFSTVTGLTWSDTGTIIITNSGTNAQTFAGGGLTYNNLTIQGAGAYALTITGSNTFNKITVDRSQAVKTLTFTDGTTQTITYFDCFVSGTTVLTMQGSAAAGWAIIKSGGSYFYLPYVSISRSTLTGGNAYLGLNSTDGGNNSASWKFLVHPKGMVK